MAFLKQFQSYFDKEELDSELVRIISQIGVNFETALIEDLAAIVNRSSDPVYFPDNRLRSWLTFFLTDVPNYTAARGYGWVEIIEAVTDVVIPKGSLILSDAGITYALQNTLYLRQGDKAQMSFIQGTMATASGTYNEFISIPQIGVEMSSVSVKIDGQVINKCKTFGDSVLPSNGFFPYYYNNTLYIKIYKGINTPNPENAYYEVSYRVCAGVEGNIPENSLSNFQDAIYDINNNEVKYKITNERVNNGASAPNKNKLVNLLRQTMFAKNSIASVPEYKAWLLSQPEIGDCMVVGDYEKYRRTGVVQISGTVDLYLMDLYGEPLSLAQRVQIQSRIEEVKDIAILVFKDFDYIQQYFLFKYRSAHKEPEFIEYVRNVFNNFFNLTYLKSINKSLFEDLNTNEILDVLMASEYAPEGMSITPYHYREVDIPTDMTTLVIDGFNGEKPGGFYELYGPEDVDTRPLLQVFKEFRQPNGNGAIFNENNVQIGSRVGTTITLNYNFLSGSLFKAYLLSKDDAIISVGSDVGARKLKGVDFERTTV